MSRVPPSLFHAASCAPPSGRMFPKAGSCFHVPVSAARCRSFFCPPSGPARNSKAGALRGLFRRTPGPKDENAPHDVRKVLSRTGGRTGKGRPDLRGHSIAEPAHDAVRSDAPRTAAGFSADVAALLNPTTPPHGKGRSRASSCLSPARNRKRRPGRPGSMKAPGPRACAGAFMQEERSRAQSSSKRRTAKTAASTPCGRGSLGIHEKRRDGACRDTRTRQSEEHAFAHGTEPALMNGQRLPS